MKLTLQSRFSKESQRRISKPLVLGLGNFLLRDDGVGVHAVRRFMQLRPRPCHAAEVGTAVFDVLDVIEKADRIIAFDAVQAGGQPGSVYLLEAEDVMDNARQDSLHETGLISVMKSLHKPLPEILIIGAEPQIIDWGIELSPAVYPAVDKMVETAEELISETGTLRPVSSSSSIGKILSKRYKTKQFSGQFELIV